MGQQQHTPEPWEVSEKSNGFYHPAEIKSGNKTIAIFPPYRISNISSKECNANAERIVACVNACAGQSIENVKLATAHRESCIKWESEMMRVIGTDSVETASNAINTLKSEREQLLQQLKKLLHMHSCEQEGIIMPTAAQWFQAVNEAEEVAFKIDPSPYNPNE